MKNINFDEINHIINELYISISKDIDMLKKENNTTHPDFDLYFKMLIETNSKQWAYEDAIRLPNLTVHEIAKLKEIIDKSNFKRVSLIEKLDKYFIENKINNTNFKNRNSLCNSETLGELIDKLIILKLKEHHVKKRINQSSEKINDNNDNLIENLNNIEAKYHFITYVFIELKRNLVAGVASIPPNCQFKLYCKMEDMENE